jgi:chaperonin GroES
MIQPTADRIVVLPDAIREDITDCGIVVKVGQNIESERQLGGTGTIVAVGPGKRDKHGNRVPLTVQAGQRIVFGEFLHREHQEDDGQRYLIMQEADICGVFE